MIFETTTRWLAAAVCLSAGLGSADTVTLAGGSSRLSGTVRSIDRNGLVELSSDLTAEPLWLKAGTVDRVEFQSVEAARDFPASVVRLANGDLLPANIEQLDDGQLTVVSPDVGRLVIPRQAVHSVEMGIRERRVILAGTGSRGDWSFPDGGDPWVFEDDAMVAKSSATAARKLELTRQFVMRFTLVWQGGRVPNFKIYFADPLADPSEAVDRYYLQFAGAGFEIKREASRGRRYNTLTILNRSYSSYTDNRVAVELRVNRDTGRMELLLNGESEGEIADPIPGIPTGSGIAFVCGNREGSDQEIRDIEVLESDDSRARHRTEDRGDTTHDSMITRDEQRWSGSLESIRSVADELVFFFKAKDQQELMEIPAQEVSTVLFAAAAEPSTPEAAHPLVLRLHREGSLAVTSCIFDGQGVTADHQLLGPLSLRRHSVAAIERATAQPPAKP